MFPLEPASRGHTMVVPNRNVSDLTDLTDAERRILGAAVRRIARAVRASVPLDGMNVIQSTGTAATHTVPHVHFHIVPRMSQASSSSKTWLLPIVTLTHGYAITKTEWWIAVLGALAVVIFGLLDANYSKQERELRKRYDSSRARRRHTNFLPESSPCRTRSDQGQLARLARRPVLGCSPRLWAASCRGGSRSLSGPSAPDQQFRCSPPSRADGSRCTGPTGQRRETGRPNQSDRASSPDWISCGLCADWQGSPPL